MVQCILESLNLISNILLRLVNGLHMKGFFPMRANPSSHCNRCDIGTSNKDCMKLWEKREFPYDLVCTKISDEMFTMTSHTPNIFGLIRCVLIGTICTNLVEIAILLRIRPIIVPLFSNTIPSSTKLDCMTLICFRKTRYIRHEAQIPIIHTYVSNLLLIRSPVAVGSMRENSGRTIEPMRL